MLTGSKSPLLITVTDNPFRQIFTNPRNKPEQRPTGGIEINTDIVDARFDHLIEGFFQRALADIVLVLADTDTLGIDLDQLGQGILQAPSDRDGSTHGQIELWEFLAGDVGGRVHAGTGFTDHHHRQLFTGLFQRRADKLFHFAPGGAVANSNHLDTVLNNQLQQICCRIAGAPAAGMGIDGNMIKKASGCIDGGQFGTGAQARVDSKHPAATGRSGEEQIAQIFGKHPDCLLVGILFRQQTQFNFDGRGNQARIRIANHRYQPVATRRLLRKQQMGQTSEDLLLWGLDLQAQKVFFFATAHSEHTMGRDLF